MIQLALLKLYIPIFLGSPKDAIDPRLLEAILRTQQTHSQEVGWVVFDRLVYDGCLLSFGRVGYKELMVMVKNKTKVRRFESGITFFFLSSSFPSLLSSVRGERREEGE